MSTEPSLETELVNLAEYIDLFKARDREIESSGKNQENNVEENLTTKEMSAIYGKEI